MNKILCIFFIIFSFVFYSVFQVSAVEKSSEFVSEPTSVLELEQQTEIMTEVEQSHSTIYSEQQTEIMTEIEQSTEEISETGKSVNTIKLLLFLTTQIIFFFVLFMFLK